jgi:hypothetical protein
MTSVNPDRTAIVEEPHTTEDAQKEDAQRVKPGSSWKASETQHLPKNRMGIVFAGLMACVFLAALDQVLNNLQLHFDKN